MKKAIALILLTLFLAGNLTACGSGAKQGNGSSEDIYEVVMEFPTLGQTPRDLQLVEDEINKRTEPEIGVHVTLYPVSAFEMTSQTNLMVSTGEKLDLACLLYEAGGVSSYVNKGVLIELDDLVEQYGQDIVRIEGPAMSGGYFNNKLYAVVNECWMGQQYGFLARKDLLDKYGIVNDPEHVYTYEELAEIFAPVKAGEGDQFYCVAGNSGDLFTSMTGYDALGASLGSGVLMDYGHGTTVVNPFATPEFVRACETARAWYEAGYFSPDCNTNTDSVLAQLQAGNYLGAYNNCVPAVVRDWNEMARNVFGEDSGFVPFYTTYPNSVTQVFQLSMWGIPITCDNPEKTMQWLNLLYADVDLTNLLYLGIEGVHWEFVEGSASVVNWAEGVDPADPPYMAVLDVWGDKSRQYVRYPADESYYQQLADFNGSIKPEHTSEALGYCFNSESVKAEYAAVNDVIAQYQSSLLYGVVDPANVLPEFLDALEAAGINTLVAENQKQFDAWRALQ